MAAFKTVSNTDVDRGIEIAKAAVGNNGGISLDYPEKVTKLIEEVAFTSYRLRTGEEPST
jgi:hypothetical protein